MKSYLDLVPLSQKVHKNQSRMVRLCIILSVFLITAIFGMADMEIRSQKAQAQINYGKWHAGLRDISDEEMALISLRPKVLACTRYDTLNYRLSMHYQIDGNEAVLIGFDEDALDIFPTAQIVEGTFPSEEGTALVDEGTKERLSLKLGDEISLTSPDGSQRPYRISGFTGKFPMLARQDVYGLMLSTEEFRKLSLDGSEDNHDSFLYVSFSPWCSIQKEIRDIQEQFQIPDDHVNRNELLLATMGQSRDVSMLAIYGVALILAFLVAIAGILMISSSLNSNIAQRTEFFGMLRCLGCGQQQIIRFVRREALYWCRFSVPAGAMLGTLCVWILSALLRYLSPAYFGNMPYFGISLIGIAAGSIIGLITVLLAAKSPAKRAALVSPLTAVSGNASRENQIRKAANTRLYKIETALGIHHALSSKRNFILMSCSFALSIILFLTFSVTIDFMNHAVKPLAPWTPDLSVVSPDNTCSLDRSLIQKLTDLEGVKRVYARSFAYDIPLEGSPYSQKACLISYDAYQFGWAEDSLIEGSLLEAIDGKGFLAVYHGEGSLQAGDEVSLGIGDGAETDSKNTGSRFFVSGILSSSPFQASNGEEILICSQETFQSLTGEEYYTVIDVQLERNAGDNTARRIRALGGENISFSDRRLGNEEVRGAVWSFRLFVYGFLGAIALICVFHVINSIAMSVCARFRQYGAMRAVGMDSRQVLKMVAAEAAAYGVWGVLMGCALGLPLSRFCFEKLITLRWGTPWYFPVVPLCIIVAVVLCSLAFSVYGPSKRLQAMSVADTIAGR